MISTIRKFESNVNNLDMNYDKEFKLLLGLREWDEECLLESILESEYCFGSLVFIACYNSIKVHSFQPLSTKLKHPLNFYRLLFYEILDHLRDTFSKKVFDIIIDRQHEKCDVQNLVFASFYCGGGGILQSIHICFDVIEKYFDREFYIIQKIKGRGNFSIFELIAKVNGQKYIMSALKQRIFIDAEFDAFLLE